jgi:hypothetical protein
LKLSVCGVEAARLSVGARKIRARVHEIRCRRNRLLQGLDSRRNLPLREQGESQQSETVYLTGACSLKRSQFDLRSTRIARAQITQCAPVRRPVAHL